MYAQFNVKAEGEWNPLLPKGVMIKLQYAHQVSTEIEIEKASEFLHAIGGSFNINPVNHTRTHTLNQEQCKRAVDALRLLLLSDTPSGATEKPLMRC